MTVANLLDKPPKALLIVDGEGIHAGMEQLIDVGMMLNNGA